MKKQELLYIFLIVLPILDLITSITSRLYNFPISLGAIIKGLLLVFFLYYILFKSKSKFRKFSLYYLVFIVVFFALYFIVKPDLLNLHYLLTEINYIFKFIFFPICFIGMLNFFDDYGFDKERINKILIINILEYGLLILLAVITKTEFNSYTTGYLGTVGWYYSANEISTILILLLPFLFCLLSSKNRFAILVMLPIIYILGLVGTKVSFLGTLIIMILAIGCILAKEKKLKSKNVIVSILAFGYCLLILYDNNAINNLISLYNKKEPEITTMPEVYYCYYDVRANDRFNINNYVFLLSDRNSYAIATNDLYNDTYNPGYLLFGMGFSNTDRISDSSINKLIEIDILDMFYHMGIFAILLFFTPFIYLGYWFIKNRKSFKISSELVFNFMILLLTLGISSIAGHVYLSPAVSIYIVLYFMLIFNLLKVFEKSKASL